MSYTRVFVSLLAAARLSRFITTDWLGEWLIVAPLKARAGWEDDPDLDMHYGTRAQRAVTGFDCPFCVSFWATLLILILDALPLPTWAARLRSLLIGSLAGSYAVGHLSSRLDTS